MEMMKDSQHEQNDAEDQKVKENMKPTNTDKLQNDYRYVYNVYNIALYFHWAYSFRVVVVVGAADAAIVYVPHHGAQNACEMNKGLYGCKE